MGCPKITVGADTGEEEGTATATEAGTGSAKGRTITATTTTLREGTVHAVVTTKWAAEAGVRTLTGRSPRDSPENGTRTRTRARPEPRPADEASREMTPQLMEGDHCLAVGSSIDRGSSVVSIGRNQSIGYSAVHSVKYTFLLLI